MYQRILVPVDGSSFSHQILPLVDALAQTTGAQVALFRAVQQADQREAAAAELRALSEARGAQAVAVATDGDAADAILAEAARVPDTLVAMTSHGRSGVLRAVMGSTALNVLRLGGRPVLVWRPREDGSPGAAPTRIERIFVPLDGSELSESIVPQALALAQWLKARPVIVSVVDPEAAALVGSDVSESGYVQNWAARLRHDHGVDAGWEVLHGDPKEALAEFVRGWPDSMMAMTTRGRSAVASALVGGVTTAALRGGLPIYASLA